MKCQNKFWIENLQDLFCSTDIVPLEGMHIIDQMNALSRLVIIVSIMLFLVGFKHSILFLLLSLLFIIILYYIQKYNMEHYREGYKQTSSERQPPTNTKSNKNGRSPVIPTIPIVNTDQSGMFCDDQLPGEPSDRKIASFNQRLVGPPNPKTRIAPIIIAPSHDLEYWRANNLINHSHINLLSEQDVYQSGYEVSTSCKNKKGAPTCLESFRLNKSPEYGTSSWHPQQEHYVEPSSGGYTQRDSYKYAKRFGKMSDDVNTSCGYNPEQILTSNLPSNYQADNRQKDPRMSTYNKNLFTQTIEPGVYSINQVNEPINSNMGISFTQQFEPSGRTVGKHGVMNTEYDPNVIEPIKQSPNFSLINAVNESNIYDPRFTGYGTSYRSYVDKELGQPRFMYDDINAVRMPNYITRNYLDFEPFGDTYGPIKEGEQDGNKYNANIRELAQSAWMDNTCKFREDLSNSLLRKRNGEMWQQRMFPINKSGQRMLGGLR